MTQRERWMAGAVAGAVALLGGIALVRSSVIAPLKAKRDDVAALRTRFDDLNARQAREAAARAQWLERTRRMLPGGMVEAHALFRADLVRLLEQHGFQNISLQPRDPISEKKGPRNGFVELPVSVSADATLGQLVDFLRDLYARPYFARVSRLTMNASTATLRTTPTPAPTGGARGGRPRGAAAAGAAAAAGRDEPRLSISFVASSLMLPRLGDVTPQALDPNQFDALPDPGLLAQEDRSVYNEIARINMFKLWTPLPAVVVTTPTEPNKPEAEVVRPPPARDPREHAGRLTLIGTTSVSAHDGQRILIALVRDDRERDMPARRYRLNDELDDGKVVVIHPAGIVVRTGAANVPPTDYYYPLGKTFKERVALDEAQHPEVVADLRRAFPAAQ